MRLKVRFLVARLPPAYTVTTLDHAVKKKTCANVIQNKGYHNGGNGHEQFTIEVRGHARPKDCTH